MDQPRDGSEYMLAMSVGPVASEKNAIIQAFDATTARTNSELRLRNIEKAEAIALLGQEMALGESHRTAKQQQNTDPLGRRQ